MLSIRFQRLGHNKQPFFRIIVQEKSKNPHSSVQEILGSYDPRAKKLEIDIEKTKKLLAQGAELSATLNNLLINQGLLTGTKKKIVKIKKTKQAEMAAAQKAATEAVNAPAPVAETSAVETIAPIAETAAPVTENTPAAETVPAVAEVTPAVPVTVPENMPAETPAPIEAAPAAETPTT
jgi:ribosomal protein S16